MEPKFPKVTVNLAEVDGNALSIVSAVVRAMRSAGISKTERDAFREEALSGNYDNVLQTAMKTVDITYEVDEEDFEEDEDESEYEYSFEDEEEYELI